MQTHLFEVAKRYEFSRAFAENGAISVRENPPHVVESRMARKVIDDVLPVSESFAGTQAFCIYILLIDCFVRSCCGRRNRHVLFM